MYGKAQQRMVRELGLEEVTGSELTRTFERIGRLGSALGHLPFCKLQGKGKHEFWGLRLWVKFKNMQIPEEERRWDDLAWRPLVSFRGHRWRTLFSLLSKL